MPMISIAIPGDGSYAEWQVTLHGETVHYGLFLAQMANFLILAAVLFVVVVKLIGRFAKARVEDPPATKDQLLLTEIRDLLRVQGRGEDPGRAVSPWAADPHFFISGPW